MNVLVDVEELSVNINSICLAPTNGGRLRHEDLLLPALLLCVARYLMTLSLTE
jgi:hypothetical protein